MTQWTVPEGLQYSRDHVWVRDDGDVLTLGITDYAVDQLGKLVYLDMPSTGDTITAGAESFDIESGKSISPFVSPVSGTIAEVNEAAADEPTLVNDSPYGDGWLLKVTPDVRPEGLLGAREYKELTD
ncbi:MAG: glycine cleavage system protein GcvH [Bifidobacteriaceae bacterium]|nr:glycine cleavage system protein GcvH [Bifidobacteriaceae bacterium]